MRRKLRRVEGVAVDICTPLEFLERWPGSLHPLALPDPPPVLPGDCRDSLTRFGLPRVVDIRALHGASMSLEFSEATVPLAVAWEADLRRGYQLWAEGQAPGVMPPDWVDLWHVGDQTYVQGGAWMCVEEGTGRMLAVDLDAPQPVNPINASVAHFLTTLAHLLDWSARTDGTAARIRELHNELLEQDCIPIEELDPFWLTEVVGHALDGTEKLTISLRGPSAPDQGGSPVRSE